MRTVVVTLCLSAAIAGPHAQTRASLSGMWEGQMLLNNTWRFMEARFTDNAADARVDLPQERRQFVDFSIDGAAVRWALVRGQTRIDFTGTLADDVIRGAADQNGVAGEFQLVRTQTAALDPDRFVGTYRTSSGDLVTVARFDFGDDVDRLAILDTRRGYWGTLLPNGSESFVFAPARSGRFPTSMHVTFRGDRGSPAAELSLTGPSEERMTARRANLYDASDVTFANGEIRLAGTIVRPKTSGDRPGVVMVHSSGNQSRNGPNAYFRLIANVLAARGVAVLVYDKRGVGGSTGAWTSASFDELAGDAQAAVAALRRAPGVSQGRVGMWSISQGGWIAPLVASRTRDVAFLTLVSAAATSPAQQEIDRVAAVMRAAGAGAADIDSASDYLRVFFDVVSGTKPWDDLATAIAGTADVSWVSYVPRPRTPQQAGWSPSPATLDPAAIFKDVRIPVLTIHGADDLDVPVANASVFARLATYPRSRQEIYPGGDHYLLTGVRDADRQFRQLIPGYLNLLVSYITAQR